MEFEEMQKIWDSQNQQTVYAINEDVLHKQIGRKSRDAGKQLIFFEWIMIISIIVVSILLLVDGDGLGERVMAGAILLIPIYLLFTRQQRRREEKQFEPSVIGELDKAIWQTDYLMNKLETILWWHILPFTVAMVITIYFQSRSVGAMLLVIAVMAASWWGE